MEGYGECLWEDTKEGSREGNYPKTYPTNTKYKPLKLIILFASQIFPSTFWLLITEYWSSYLLLVDIQFAVVLIHMQFHTLSISIGITEHQGWTEQQDHFSIRKPRASREVPRPSSSPTDASRFRRLFKGHEAPLLCFHRPLILSILRHYCPNFKDDETRARRNWVACPSSSLGHWILMPKCLSLSFLQLWPQRENIFVT